MPVKVESEALANYWLQQIEAWQSSGQTQQAYCKTNALSYHRFGYWRRKFRQQSQEAQSQKGSGFVPVTHSATSQSAIRRLNIIDKALSILEERIRVPGVSISSPDDTIRYPTLKLAECEHK